MNDQDYMRLALELAQQGRGWTSPNPMVGAVIVKDGRVIAQGYHARCGDLHAERAALANCTEDPRGSTMYVTLEPCCHHGRQPPCTDAILEAGIARVVVGSGDPNPQVAGKGLNILRDAGVHVTEGVCTEECRALNDVFFHYIQTGRPYVVLKYAMTLDGKLAASRPLVDNGWLPHEKQIGQSGTAVKPKYIFNIAISGSVQYQVGMQNAGCVISINHTKGAPIFDISHYGAVADYKTVVPALVEEIKRRKA